jgi:hypothetical protein
MLTPEPLDQVIGADRAVRLEPEHGEHGARLGPAERKRPPADAGFDGAENVELHRGLSHDSFTYRLPAQRQPGGRCECCGAPVYARYKPAP